MKETLGQDYGRSGRIIAWQPKPNLPPFLSTLGASGLSTLDVNVKESSEQIGMGSKGGLLKAIIGFFKLAEASLSRIIEDSQRPNHT